MPDFEVTQDLFDALDYELEFGEHKGMTIANLLENYPGYAHWMLKQPPSTNAKFSKAVQMLKIAKGVPPDIAKQTSPVIQPAPHKKKYKTLAAFAKQKAASCEIIFTYLSQVKFTDFKFKNPAQSDTWNNIYHTFLTNQTDYMVMIKRTAFGDQLLSVNRRKEIEKRKGEFIYAKAC